MMGEYGIEFCRKQYQYVVVEAKDSCEAFAEGRKKLTDKNWDDYGNMVEGKIINYPSEE